MKALIFLAIAVLIPLANANADKLMLCNDQMQCTPVAQGAQAIAAFGVTARDCGGDLDSGCMRECRINHTECRNEGGDRNTCAALRTLCETHCRR